MPLPSPEWKWEHITMNFLFGVPRMPSGLDEIGMIVDRFTKTASLIPIKQTFPLGKLAKLYVDKVNASLLGGSRKEEALA
ncbi:retrotransposon protein, putative, Ty3-gypsy subclass [Cucumis melo var. makuwa]|uniref:Retrotransposon protein, putative, Ty3-gypsy subclass n=1 Tax=Cucumis melo var. makuwa TaxID=1194695 RepID=A0A5A7VNI7_CUCMM|nr:retrotransposon protein, putative, Ty3-gypsy subclass [Cucumis melo var. makuwa]TYK21066.1 retrotransposon protein, putative, Ty3-gypsy subclass [Cucumis melo var. makuwa]